MSIETKLGGVDAEVVTSDDELLATPEQIKDIARNNEFMVQFAKLDGTLTTRRGKFSIEEYILGTGEPLNNPDIQPYEDQDAKQAGSKRPIRSFKWSRTKFVNIDGQRYRPITDNSDRLGTDL